MLHFRGHGRRFGKRDGVDIGGESSVAIADRNHTATASNSSVAAADRNHTATAGDSTVTINASASIATGNSSAVIAGRNRANITGDSTVTIATYANFATGNSSAVIAAHANTAAGDRGRGGVLAGQAGRGFDNRAGPIARAGPRPRAGPAAPAAPPFQPQRRLAQFVAQHHHRGREVERGKVGVGGDAHQVVAAVEFAVG